MWFVVKWILYICLIVDEFNVINLDKGTDQILEHQGMWYTIWVNSRADNIANYYNNESSRKLKQISLSLIHNQGIKDKEC